MSYFPDFEGYEVEKELGYNPSGGRITYLARLANNEKVKTPKSNRIMINLDRLIQLIFEVE